jgi:hypothetical protein
LEGEPALASTHREDIRVEEKHHKRSYAVLKRFPYRKREEILKAEDATSVVWGVLMRAQ